MDKIEAKKLLLKGKMYRFFAAMFAFIGVLLVVYLYHQNQKEHGNFLMIFKDWLAIVIIVIPFLPAAIFAMMAKKAEGKLEAFFSELEKKS